MFEDLLLIRPALAGEVVRIVLAMLGTAIASWYDLTNNRNVPDSFLKAFLIFSLAASVLYFQQDVFLYGFVVAAVLFSLGYLSYKMGYIGGADVFVLASIALLLPVFPSNVRIGVNLPPVLSVIITSCVLFSLYFFAFILLKVVLAGKKGRMEYLLLLVPYGALVYFMATAGIFGISYAVVLSVLMLSSILFAVYKQSVTEAMAKLIPLSKADEEDVAVPELMPELTAKYGIKRLLDAKELARLKKLKVKSIYVYTDLPPFLPFVLAALLVTIVFGDLLYSLAF